MKAPGLAGSVIAFGALLAFAAAPPAHAVTVTQAPEVSADGALGNPATADELIASTGSWTPDSATPAYDWLRCNAVGASCAPISGACGRRYTVRADDVGRTLRARLTVTGSGGDADARESAPTPVLEFRYVLGPVDPIDTCTRVTPTGPGEGIFSSGEQTGSGTLPPPDTSLNFIDPFPVVRIAGRFSRRRTRLSRVTINAPSRSRIRVSCRGRGCPYRRKAIAVKFVRVRRLQRSYRPRATIEIRVTQPRRIGKFTRVKTRRGKAPLRIDRCLMPGKTRPVKCPTA